MSARPSSGLRNIDWATFSLFLGLVAVGWLMVFTVGYEEDFLNNFSGFFRTGAGRQTIWIGISLVVFSLMFLIDWKFWQTFSFLLYAISLVLLVAVLFFGVKIKGATSWFYIGGFSFQPSELAKFATCLAISSYLSLYSTSLKQLQSQLVAIGLFLAPMALILLQPDAGSAMVFLSFLIVLYREGLSQNYFIVGATAVTTLLLGLVYDPIYLIIGLLCAIILILAYYFKIKNRHYLLMGAVAYTIGIYFAVQQNQVYESFYASLALASIFIFLHWRQRRTKLVGILSAATVVFIGLAFAANYAFNNVLKPHQQDRINVWLRPSKCDPRGSLYNVLQSKMAISSGGLEGKGFLEGTMTKLNYVPEQSTDFIFCTVGEEQGFIGSFGVITLFFLLLYRITIVAERQRNNFARHYGYCVAGILFFHFFINIGMTMGLMPIIGIPLPFISKGGSALLGFTLMIGVLLKLDSNRYRI